MEDTSVEEPEVSGAAEFAPALVAAHPHGNSAAVAIGPDIRVFDLRTDYHPLPMPVLQPSKTVTYHTARSSSWHWQGSLDVAGREEVLALVLAALKVSMHKMLVKKHYSEERREQRKRGRSD